MINIYNYSQKYQSIQTLRGAACLLVVAFHMSLQLKDYYNINQFYSLFSQGYAGVDLFFVISGFVIAHSSHKLIGKSASVGRYYIKRFLRIFPLYWLILLPSIAGLLVIMPNRIPAGDPISIFAYWLNSTLLLPDHEPVNAVSWSLSHELYFYVLFGLLIINTRFWIFLAILIGITITGLTNVYIPNALEFYFSPFNLEFCAGILIWYISKWTKISLVLSAVTIIIGLMIVVLFQNIVTNENHTIRVVIFGSASALLLFGLVEIDKSGKFKSPRFLATIGDASYVLYLFHLPFMIIINKIIREYIDDVMLVIYLNLLLFVISTFLSIYIHKYLEKPLLNYFFSLVNQPLSVIN